MEMIDELYSAFAETLHGPLADSARGLACTLKLAPSADIPWSKVFGHEVTLAAPALFAEAMPAVSSNVVRDAVMAHMLAVIEAFGTDRIEDGQVSFTPELMAVLGHMRRARDRAIRRVCPEVVDASLDFKLADEKTLRAIEAERSVLTRGEAVDLRAYELASLGKQSVGFPASLALAFAAGWGASQRRSMFRSLASVWLGLQMHDDVVDWEDDFARSGAWAVALARGQRRRDSIPGERPTEGVAVRRRVLESGVLAKMLERSRQHFRAAKRRADALGAHELARWARERESKLAQLVASEAKSAGFAVRAHALSAWATEVLA